jgi:anti-anti-sigma factor
MTIHDLTARAAAVPRTRPRTEVWTWEGEVDVASLQALRAELRARLVDRPATLVVDLTQVTFLDCAGLSVLVRANAQPCTRVLLQGVPTCVQRLLVVTGLSAVFSRVADDDPPAA